MPVAALPLQQHIEAHALTIGLIFGVGFAVLLFRRRDLFLRGVPDISAEALALFRVFYGLAMIIALNYYDQRGSVTAPRDYPWWGSWNWVDSFATNPDLVNAVQIVGTVALVMFAIGFLARFALVIATGAILLYVLYILEASGAHNWGLPFLVMLSLNFVPGWSHAFSVDEAIRRLRGRSDRAPRRGTAYGLGLWLPGAVWGIAFLAAAFAKIRNSGFDWGFGGAVQYHFVEDGLLAPTNLGLWIASHEWVAILFSTSALVIEAAFIGHAFFRSGWIRFAFAGAAFGILLGFFLFQGVFWFPWWVLLLAFLPWEQIWQAVTGALARYVVLIDGRCPLCMRTSRRLSAMDWLNRLEFADATDPGARERFAPGLSEQAAVADMHIVRMGDERVFRGFDAYARMSRSTFLLWPMALVASLPKISRLEERVYSRVAAGRLREECSAETCALHGREHVSAPALPHRWRTAQQPAMAAFGLPVLILLSVLITEQTGISLAGQEREPLMSNYPMYSYTFSSRDEFDARIRPLSRFNDFRFSTEVDGRTTDVTEEFETTGLGEILEASIIDPEFEPDSERLAKARANYESTFGKPPPTEVKAKRIAIVFDWDEGDFKRIPEPGVTPVSTTSVTALDRTSASTGAGA